MSSIDIVSPVHLLCLGLRTNEERVVDCLVPFAYLTTPSFNFPISVSGCYFRVTRSIFSCLCRCNQSLISKEHQDHPSAAELHNGQAKHLPVAPHHPRRDNFLITEPLCRKCNNEEITSCRILGLSQYGKLINWSTRRLLARITPPYHWMSPWALRWANDNLLSEEFDREHAFDTVTRFYCT